MLDTLAYLTLGPAVGASLVCSIVVSIVALIVKFSLTAFSAKIVS